MSYPQYPASGAMAAYPQQPLPAQQVSGGTAIATGVLAGLGAAWSAISFLIGLFGFGLIDQMPSGFAALFFVSLILNLVLAGLLGTGAVMIFTKKPLGKWLVVSGCGVAIALQLVGLIVGLAMSSGGRVSGMVGGGIASIIFMIPAIVTLVLALLPTTGKWLQQGKQPAAAPAYGAQGGHSQQGGYPQQGGYSQQGGYPQGPPSGGYPQQGAQSGGHPQQGPPPQQW